MAAIKLKVPPKDVKPLSDKIVSGLDDIPVNSKNKELLTLAKEFEGIVGNTSVHASAVVVFPKDPTEFCAIERVGNTFCAGYDYHELEELGLAKVDVLGLKNLDIIEETLRLIKDRGLDLDINSIPLSDSKTAKLLCKGHTNGVFQVESEIMKGIIKGIQPEGYKDLIAVVALGRPACLVNGIVGEYIKNRKESKLNHES